MQCHYRKEHIEAYLDGELSREERKAMALHIENCAKCQGELHDMKKLDEWVKVALEESLFQPSGKKREPDSEAAWNLFRTRLEEEAAFAPQTKKLSLWKGRWDNMKNNRRRWVAGGVAAAVFAAALFVPQVRAAASDMLGMLRIDKVQTVKLTPEDLASISNKLSALKNGEIDLKDLGRVSIDGKQVSQPYASVAAAQKAGVNLPDLKGYKAEALGKESAFTATMQFNVDKLEALSKQLGSEVDLDAKLNDQSFSIAFAPSIYAHYQSISDVNVQLIYGETSSPQINVPDGVDLDQVRSAMLKATFLPEDVRTQLAGIQDWQSTLPIPYVEGQDYAENLTVNGASGVFVAQSGGQSATLVWQGSGLMHMLSARISGGETQGTGALKTLLLDAAKQF